MTAPLLETHGLAVGFGALRFCEGLGFRVMAGETWVIVGPNGAGKTTLIRTLAGLLRPLAGTVTLDGVPLSSMNLRARATARALLPQDDSDAFAVTALEAVLAARHPHLAWHAFEAARDLAIARDALAAFAVDALAGRDVRTLSGGERRRVALAELVAQSAPLMLLDEPSSHLDIVQQVASLDALAALSRSRGSALVMVLHDLHLAARYASHVITLAHGRAHSGNADAMLDGENLSGVFGRPLEVLGSGRMRAYIPQDA